MAKKLIVVNDGTDRAEWLDARRGLYTATQISAIAGTNPYYGIVDVWNEHTDPDWTEDAARNRWLNMRADKGVEREPEIIAWANEDPRTGGGFVPNSRLLRIADVPENHASTPDAIKEGARGGNRVLIECKTTSQRWDRDGLPDHIYDQVQWQLYTCGAVTCWVAVEFYEWSKGKQPVATLVGTHLVNVKPDQRRLDYLLAKLEQFEADEAAGIAPESEVLLADLAAPVFDFDDDPETVAAKEAAAAEAAELDGWLRRVAEIDAQTKPLLDERKGLDAKVKAKIKTYHGRRVDLVGAEYTGRLIRGTRSKLDTSWLDEFTLREHTDWVPSETVTLMPTPKTESE